MATVDLQNFRRLTPEEEMAERYAGIGADEVSPFITDTKRKAWLDGWKAGHFATERMIVQEIIKFNSKESNIERLRREALLAFMFTVIGYCMGAS